MASSYDVINLSALAVPDAIVVPDAADIFTRWLARLRELDTEFDALVESDPRINRVKSMPTSSPWRSSGLTTQYAQFSLPVPEGPISSSWERPLTFPVW